MPQFKQRRPGSSMALSFWCPFINAWGVIDPSEHSLGYQRQRGRRLPTHHHRQTPLMRRACEGPSRADILSSDSMKGPPLCFRGKMPPQHMALQAQSWRKLCKLTVGSSLWPRSVTSDRGPLAHPTLISDVLLIVLYKLELTKAHWESVMLVPGHLFNHFPCV